MNLQKQEKQKINQITITLFFGLIFLTGLLNSNYFPKLINLTSGNSNVSIYFEQHAPVCIIYDVVSANFLVNNLIKRNTDDYRFAGNVEIVFLIFLILSFFLFNSIIKVRYYYPIFIFCRVLRI